MVQAATVSDSAAPDSLSTAVVKEADQSCYFAGSEERTTVVQEAVASMDWSVFAEGLEAFAVEVQSEASVVEAESSVDFEAVD